MRTRPSPRLIITVAIAAAAIAAVAWLFVGALTYDGLQHGASASVGPDGTLVNGGMRKELHGGRVTEFGVSVLNSGSHSVEITGIGVPGRSDDAQARHLQFTPVGARMAPADDTGTAVELVPFRPFTLEPGRQRYFMLAVRMPACSNFAPGTSTDIDRFVVRFKALFIPREQTIKLHRPIDFVRGAHCS